ncbi:MAG: hypothetical protein QOE48_5856 [Mycobacterium sp.]|nr:hypothetical protein [Mycobacterium sp.]
MSAPAPPTRSLPLGRLDEPATIDDVLRNVDQIIDWSIKAESHIGYFAVLYKRTTLAIRAAINEGVFDDGHRMAELDVAFARRYFNALNAYFHPSAYTGLTLPWEVAFVGDQDSQAIILQHLMAGLNAHITFDLGLAVLAIAADSLDTLERDFNRVNALLCSQIPGVLEAVDKLSPELRRTRWLVPDQIGVLNVALRKLRNGAWFFATCIAMHPQNATEKTVNHEAWTAALGSWYLQPSQRWTPFPRLIRAIGKHESRNVASNIAALEPISKQPDTLHEAYL